MTHDVHGCDALRHQLDAYLEGELSPANRAATDAHLEGCAECAALLADVRAIAASAAALPRLEPTRDLWSGIEARIRTPVASFGGAAERRSGRSQWPLAAAAAALVALSAGTTWWLTSRPSGAVAIPGANAAQRTQPTSVGTLAATKKNVNAARIYDREITLLDSMISIRRDALDPRTVAVIEKNLRIIDNAIAESRVALARDPNSPLLTDRLNNVLGSKVELLRTVAFLPSRS